MALFVAAGGIQLLPSPIPSPVKHEPHVAQTTRLQEAVNPEVRAIIQRACRDCHSNETVWPWYSHVAPVSWMVARDVAKGREKLDFSDWSARKRSPNEVEEICDAVTNQSMPLPGYLLLHREARLSKDDVDVICSWADKTKAETRRLAQTRGSHEKGGRSHR